MRNPRFEWINWNSICNTALEILIQTQTAKTGALSADESKSGSLIQPSLRSARRPPEGASECTRAVYAARGSGARTREADRQRLVTDGGTEAVTFRIDDPELQEALNDAAEEYDSRSAALRAAVRQTFTGSGDAPTTTAEGRPTKKAIEAHDWMVEYAGIGGRIGVETAESLIAQKLQIQANTVKNLVLRPLRTNGWIELSQGVNHVAVVIKPRPDAQDADTTAEEVPADD